MHIKPHPLPLTGAGAFLLCQTSTVTVLTGQEVVFQHGEAYLLTSDRTTTIGLGLFLLFTSVDLTCSFSSETNDAAAA